MQDHSNTKIPKVRCILAHPQTIRPLTASETHQTKTRYFPLNEIEKKKSPILQTMRDECAISSDLH